MSEFYGAGTTVKVYDFDRTIRSVDGQTEYKKFSALSSDSGVNMAHTKHNAGEAKYSAFLVKNGNLFLVSADPGYAEPLEVQIPATYTNVSCFDIETRSSDGKRVVVLGRKADATNNKCVGIFTMDWQGNLLLESEFTASDLGASVSDSSAKVYSVAFSPNGQYAGVAGIGFCDTISWFDPDWQADMSGVEDGAHCTGFHWIDNSNYVLLVCHSGVDKPGAAADEAYLHKDMGGGGNATFLSLGTGVSTQSLDNRYINGIDVNLLDTNILACHYHPIKIAIVDLSTFTVLHDIQKGYSVRGLVWRLDDDTKPKRLRWIHGMNLEGVDFDGTNWVDAASDYVGSNDWVEYAEGNAEVVTVDPVPGTTGETHFTAFAWNTAGTLIAKTTTTTGASMSLNIPVFGHGKPLLVTCAQGVAPFQSMNLFANKWQADSNYPVDKRVIPTDYKTNSHLFKCTAAGQTGSSEPTWDTSSVGATTTDGGVTWEYLGKMLKPQSNYPEIVGTNPMGGGGGAN